MIRAFLFLMVLPVFFFFLFGCEGTNDEKKAGVNKTEADTVSEEIIVQEKLKPQEFAAWVNNKNNGLAVEKTIGEFTYSLLYKPLEYVAMMDLKIDSIKKDQLSKKVKEYEGMQYFNFKIKSEKSTDLLRANLKSKRAYYERVQYYSFEMQHDLKLIDGTDTLDCMLFHFERVYGVAPYATFVLGFPATNNKNDKTLAYNERIFGAGKVYLKIHAKNIKKVPTLMNY